MNKIILVITMVLSASAFANSESEHSILNAENIYCSFNDRDQFQVGHELYKVFYTYTGNDNHKSLHDNCVDQRRIANKSTGLVVLYFETGLVIATVNKKKKAPETEEAEEEEGEE